MRQHLPSLEVTEAKLHAIATVLSQNTSLLSTGLHPTGI
jgi:hypothetical protein